MTAQHRIKLPNVADHVPGWQPTPLGYTGGHRKQQRVRVALNPPGPTPRRTTSWQPPRHLPNPDLALAALTAFAGVRLAVVVTRAGA